MRSKVYLNRIKTNYQYDFSRAVDYFKRHGIDMSFDFEQSDYKNLSYMRVNYGHGDRIILQPSMAQKVPIDPLYDFTIFTFDQNEFTPPNLPNGYCYVPLKPFIDFGTNQNNPKDLDYVTLCHEIMHALSYILEAKGVPNQINAIMDTYYKNMELDNPLSNFGQCWAILKPYVSLIQGATSPVVTITRQQHDNYLSLGKLDTEGFSCLTLELPDKNNQPNISDIPKGTYQCVWSFMPSRLTYHYEVKNVPQRSGVFIHSGNYFWETKGCILLGDSYADINHDGHTDILNSKKTLQAFEQIMNKKNFTLKII